ncbi:MAG: type II toxin-antitoxin system HicB family antitoxin [Chitinophagaceae bacterium]|nr:type II toxin-antitoxin system HicB family antitoxin [Chitinophagaceae bacterium]MCB0739490.1 type II toxin-antitoxin system HicB family antitoxin [Chitinophagaceae bacterium]HQU55841.1 type II toxin-antitoxin system HicB family antitoxin [Chitinophagaceae bacterium]HQV05216.1 type II toxin-antitoxin system HicB family antitoxin [Chitinophagaceae bacterium]
MLKTRTFRIVLRKEPEGAYTALVPSLPGCITWGETVEKTLDMAKDAIENYIAVLREEGEQIPDDNETLEYSIQLSA